MGYFIAGHILYERFKDKTANLKKKLLCIAVFFASSLVTIVATCVLSATMNEPYTPLFWYKSIFIVISAFAVFILFIITNLVEKVFICMSKEKIDKAVNYKHDGEMWIGLDTEENID